MRKFIESPKVQTGNQKRAYTGGITGLIWNLHIHRLAHLQSVKENMLGYHQALTYISS